MGLISAVRGALVPKAPDKANSATSMQALGVSSMALATIGKSGTESTGLVRSAVNLVTRPLNQAGQQQAATSMGRLTAEANHLKEIKGPMLKGIKAWEAGQKDKIEILKAAAKAGQNVSKVNAEAQLLMGTGHRQAAADVRYANEAYGGWSGL
jgi:hypothetical protein